ncbi:MAG: zinc ribbon domain-containing protein [Vicinamibacterales bacterium]
MQLRKTFLWSMIASLGLAALLGIAALLLPSYGLEEEIITSASVFGGFSIAALMCAVVLERRRAVVSMWTGLGFATAALFAWLSLVWFDRYMSYSMDRIVVQAAGTFTVGGVLAAQSGLLILPRFDNRYAGAVRRLTIVVSMLFAVYVWIMIWWFDELASVFGSYTLARAMGVQAILAACGTVVTPILWKTQTIRRTGTGGAIPLQIDVKIVCPRCHSEQELKPGDRSCGTCGLRIKIELEEPRCECGYLLHKLENDRCPECGRAIDERDRWAVQ